MSAEITRSGPGRRNRSRPGPRAARVRNGLSRPSALWQWKNIPYRTATLALSVALPVLGGCSCGFDCHSDSDRKIAVLDLGFSDESLEQLKQVVIEVDSITLRRGGSEDVVVDTFTIDELGLVEADSFQVDLLQYRGLNRLPVIEGLELDAANYSELRVAILDGDINRSYVQQSDDSLRAVDVAGGVLTLPAPSLPAGPAEYTVVFGLAQALQYRQGEDVYRLTTEGVRVVDDATAASLSGRVDDGLFDGVAPCDGKADPTSGNRVYLYPADTLATDPLADVFTADSANAIPDGARAPYAVAAMAPDALTGRWQYAFGFVAPGSYTLAFSCDAAEDDPVDFDGIAIPLPVGQVQEIELAEGESGICDLAEDTSCS